MDAVTYAEYGPPDVLHVTEVATLTPRDNDVRSRGADAADSTTDAALRGDPLMRVAFGVRTPKHPILGTEFAGDVVTVGKNVTRFKPGDRVFAATGSSYGAHAGDVCLPHDGALARMPADAAFADAAAICEEGLTALPFLRGTGQIRPGQRVPIDGAAGAVGAAAVQLAKRFGANVTGVCGPAHTALAESLGADTVIDDTRQDFASSGPPYDILFDAVGKSSFARCKGALAVGGIYLSTVPTARLLANVLWTARFSAKKARMAATGLRSPARQAKDLDLLRCLAEAGAFVPVADSVYPMTLAADAHRRVETGHKTGSAILAFD